MPPGSSASAGTTTRQRILQVLHDVRAGRPFDQALDAAATDLSPDDRRLAHEIAAGVLRHEAALDHQLAPLVKGGGGWRRVSPALQDILRLGAYQLRFLDRVPPHAAVNTTVSLAKEAGGKKAAGFVNAILRRVADAPATETGATDAGLAERHSHPAWLVERWRRRFGPEATARLLEWNNTPPALCLQPARWTAEAIGAALDGAGIGWSAAPWDAGIEVKARRPSELPGYREGAFVIQDPSQSLVARYAKPPEGALVLDACAAPGGKATALAATARLLVAADLRRKRIGRLRENLERAGVGSISVVVADAAAPPMSAADLVLVDAPCSATGTMARHPDARLRLTRHRLEGLVRRQTEILEGAATAVRPGGWLVYATCSLEPEENEMQVERFLEDHPDFTRAPEAGWPPALVNDEGDLALLPQVHGVDGAYASRLRRQG